MSTNNQNRILLVDDNQIFRQALAQRLQTAGYQVVTEESGERAFLSVRNWQRPIDWLYTRAALPRMVDGWILGTLTTRSMRIGPSSSPLRRCARQRGTSS